MRVRFCKYTLPIFATSSWLHTPVLCNSQSNDNKERIVVRLTPQSQQFLKEKLLKLKLIDNNSNSNINLQDVILWDHVSAQDVKDFQNVYGNRVAFRMKGYTRSTKREKDKVAAIYGSVRGMGPEMRLNGEIPTMPMNSSIDSTRLFQISSTLPKRFLQSAHYSGKPYSVLKLPATKGFDSISAEGIELPFDSQLVIDGYLCPFSYLTDEIGGNPCSYERDELELELEGEGTKEVEAAPTENKPIEKDVDVSNSHTTENKEAFSADNSENSNQKPSESKCPLCRYIENGPCRKTFNEWEDCMAVLNKKQKEDKEKKEQEKIAQQKLSNADPNFSSESESDGHQEIEEEEQDLNACFPHTQAMMRCFIQHEYYDMMTANMHDQIRNTWRDETNTMEGESGSEAITSESADTEVA